MIHHEVEVEKAKGEDDQTFVKGRSPIRIGEDFITIKHYGERCHVLERPVLAPEIQAQTQKGDQEQGEPGKG